MPSLPHHAVAARCFLPPVILSIAATVIAWALWRGDPGVTDEHRLIENSQVFFAAVGMALHARHWRQTASRRESPAALYHAILALLLLSVIVRETDIDTIGDPPFWPIGEQVVRITIVGLWLGAAAFVLKGSQALLRHSKAILAAPASRLVVIGIFLYILSRPFDKGLIPIDPSTSQLAEESLQLAACIFFAASGFHRLPARQAAPHPHPQNPTPT